LACCSTDQEVQSPHQKVPHREKEKQSKTPLFLYPKIRAVLVGLNLVLLKFKSVRRASQVAYNHWKRNESNETINLKFQHFKKRKNMKKNNSTSPGFF
jgi:hypothetical protein